MRSAPAPTSQDHRDQRTLRDLLVALDDGSGAEGTRRVAEMLMNLDMLPEALCDADLSRDQALSLARSAVAISPSVRYQLMGMLSEKATGNESSLLRLMDVLAELCGEDVAPPGMRRLTRHESGALRAKAARAICRTERNVERARRALRDPDPRVRANAAEALWGYPDESNRLLLRKAAQDQNRRVRANALLGLFKFGDDGARKLLLDMSADASPFTRAAAAWAMGKSSDPQFSEPLGWMLGDADSRVRKRAFTALAELRQSTT